MTERNLRESRSWPFFCWQMVRIRGKCAVAGYPWSAEPGGNAAARRDAGRIFRPLSRAHRGVGAGRWPGREEWARHRRSDGLCEPPGFVCRAWTQRVPDVTWNQASPEFPSGVICCPCGRSTFDAVLSVYEPGGFGTGPRACMRIVKCLKNRCQHRRRGATAPLRDPLRAST